MKVENLKKSRLYGLQTVEELSEVLLLGVWFKRVPKATKHLYKVYPVDKKQSILPHSENGEKKAKRWVQEPCFQLMQVQRRMHFLFMQMALPAYVYTFKGHIENAAQHADSKTAATLDIDSFFCNAKSGRGFRLFQKHFACSGVVASLLADLTSYDGHLPTGSPVSPMLSFWAYKEMWDEIDVLCRKNGFIFTLYMDDLTISGNRVTQKFIKLIKKVLRKHGLKAKPGKTMFFEEGDNKRITGVDVLPDGTLTPTDELYEKTAYLMSLGVLDSKAMLKLIGILNEKLRIERANYPRHTVSPVYIFDMQDQEQTENVQALA